MAIFDFVLQFPLTVTAESEDEAQTRADEWFIQIQQALMEAGESLMEKGGVMVVGPAAIVLKKTASSEAA